MYSREIRFFSDKRLNDLMNSKLDDQENKSLANVSSSYRNQLSAILFGTTSTYIESGPIVSPAPPTCFPTNTFEPEPNAYEPKRNIKQNLYKIDTVHTLGVSNEFYSNNIAWDPNNKIHIGVQDTVQTFNTKNNYCDAIFSDLNNKTVTCVNAQHSQYVYAATENTIYQIDSSVYRPSAVIKKIAYEDNAHVGISRIVSSVDSESFNSKLLFAATRQYCTYGIDPRSGNVCYTFPQNDVHSSWVSGLAFDQKYALATGSLYAINIWDIRQPTTPYRNIMELESAKAIQFHPNNSKIIAFGGGRDTPNVIVWDVEKSSKILSVSNRSQVTCLHWASPSHLLTGHGYISNSMCLWNIKGKPALVQEKREHAARILAMAAAPDGIRYATLGADLVHIWKTNIETKNENSDSTLRMPPIR